MSLGHDVDDLARPRTVTRRSALVYDGSVPRPVGPPAEIVATVSLTIQRETAKPTALDRQADGDETTTTIRVWASDRALALAEDVTNPGVPLNWTDLQVAPPENADGPGGDLIDWQGRRYEVTELTGWDEDFDGDDAGFRRYAAEERGATP